MICRLCLTNLKLGHVVELFETSTNETKLVKIIAKFFYLEITLDDPISTKICQKCVHHLEDFHAFWTSVEAKQKALRKDFVAAEPNLAVEPNINTTNTLSNSDEFKYHDNQDEELLDIKTIQMPLEVFYNENVFEATEKDSLLVEDANALDPVADDNCNTDDDIPLLQLKSRVKKKKGSVSNKKQIVYKGAKIQRNINIIDQAMDLNCDLCKASVEGFAQLRTHFSEKHDCPPYVMCCGKSYNQPSKLIQHINWHNSLFKCDICEKDLRSAKRLVAHKESFHSIKTDKAAQLTCIKCSKGFSSEKCLKNHISICNNEQVFTCSICTKGYSTEKRLQNHITSQHVNEKPKTINCKSCEKTFPTVARMRKHFETIHEKVCYHVCDVCGKQFRFKPSFMKHVLEHKGIVEATVQCNLCGEWLKNTQALRLHKFKHDTVNVKCQYCGKICNSRRALICHINYMHKLDKNLQCKFCDKTFRQPRNLDEHMAIHTGAQLYSCPHCTKECRSKSNMYVHIKRNHMKEWLESRAARSNDPSLNNQLQNQDQDELNYNFS